MTYQTKGIILKKTDRGEADQLFSIYTKKTGKILALGRATKKIQSKLNGNLQHFAVIDLMIAPGKSYDHIAGVIIDKNFPAIKSNFKKIILGSFGLELVEKLTKVEQPDLTIFILLDKYLQVVNDNSFNNLEWQKIKQAFVVKFLSLLGFAPPIGIVSSQKKLDNFLKNHLDSELESEKFLIKMMPLVSSETEGLVPSKTEGLTQPLARGWVD